MLAYRLLELTMLAGASRRRAVLAIKYANKFTWMILSFLYMFINNIYRLLFIFFNARHIKKHAIYAYKNNYLFFL